MSFFLCLSVALSSPSTERFDGSDDDAQGSTGGCRQYHSATRCAAAIFGRAGQGDADIFCCEFSKPRSRRRLSAVLSTVDCRALLLLLTYRHRALLLSSVFFWLPPLAAQFCNLLASLAAAVAELYERLSKALRTFLKRDETLQNIDFRSAKLTVSLNIHSLL